MKEIKISLLTLALAALFLAGCASQPNTVQQENRAEDANAQRSNGLLGSHY